MDQICGTMTLMRVMWRAEDKGIKQTSCCAPRTKFSTVVYHGGDLGPEPRRFSHSGFFVGFFVLRVMCPCGPVIPPLNRLSFPPLVAAVLITPKGAVSYYRLGPVHTCLYVRVNAFKYIYNMSVSIYIYIYTYICIYIYAFICINKTPVSS